MSDNNNHTVVHSDIDDHAPGIKKAKYELTSSGNNSFIDTQCSKTSLSEKVNELDCHQDSVCKEKSSLGNTNISPLINNSLFSHDIQRDLRNNYIASTDFTDGVTRVELSCSPFRHFVLPNFINDKDYIASLESFLYRLPLREKNNDLYKFSQSQDLSEHESPVLSQFRLLCEDVRKMVSHVTEIPLNNKIDLFCSQYRYTEILLCHDDELEERRIAFIYYLVPEDWSQSDGGTLDLFSSDENGQPKDTVKSIVPQRNNFVFFEVSAKSFHQVAEVLCEDKTRLSISGWFHGPPLRRFPPYVEDLPPAMPYGSIEEDVFYAWINPLYLAPEVQMDIRKRFEEDSEIELTDFLQEEKYAELVAALQEESIEWTLLGPANKRHYYTANREQLSSPVSEFFCVMTSDAAFLVLSNLTGLRLHPLAQSDDNVCASGSTGQSSVQDGSNPRCRCEVRKWEHGCYTLAHDTDRDVLDFALDTMMYIGCDKEWKFETGGYTSYIGKGEDEELLSVCPARNSLALVYRDKETMKFVKHLNHRVTKLLPPKFFEINTVFYE